MVFLYLVPESERSAPVTPLLRWAIAIATASTVLGLSVPVLADPGDDPTPAPSASPVTLPSVTLMDSPRPSLIATATRAPRGHTQPRTVPSHALVTPTAPKAVTDVLVPVSPVSSADPLQDVAVWVDKQPWYMKSSPWFALSLGLVMTMVGYWGIWSSRRDRLEK